MLVTTAQGVEDPRQLLLPDWFCHEARTVSSQLTRWISGVRAAEEEPMEDNVEEAASLPPANPYDMVAWVLDCCLWSVKDSDNH